MMCRGVNNKPGVVSADSFTTTLLSSQLSIKYGSSPVEFHRLLSDALNDHVIMMPPRLDNELRKLLADIVEPTGETPVTSLHLLKHNF